MAGVPGPIPNTKHTRDRTPAGQVEYRELVERKPARPPTLRRGLSARTRAWFKTWTGSPQAALFTATDWARLAMLAELVDAYFAEPTPARMAEIRLNESRFGATPEDRLRLRWRFRDRDADVELGVAIDPGKIRTGRPKRRRGDPRLELVE